MYFELRKPSPPPPPAKSSNYLCKFKQVNSEYSCKPELFAPVILMKSTHFKYASPNLLDAHGQQQTALPSAPPMLLSSHFSPQNNKCLQWRRKVKTSESNTAQDIFLSMEDTATLTVLTALSVVVSHTSMRVQGKQCNLKCKLGKCESAYYPVQYGSLWK